MKKVIGKIALFILMKSVRYFNMCVGILLSCFYEYDENKDLEPGDYIIIERMKYNHEEEYEYLTNILSVDSDGYSLTLNDNWEGQEDYKIIAYAPLYTNSEILKKIDDEIKKGGKTT